MEAMAKTMNRQEFFRVLGIGVGAASVANSLSACDSKAEVAPVGSDALDLTIQLDDVRYSDLLKKGYYVVVDNRVIVASVQPNQYVAVSPKCTHEGTTLVYKAGSNSFYCALDGSRYDITGKVLNGPATQPLRVYKISNDQKSNSLRIFS